MTDTDTKQNPITTAHEKVVETAKDQTASKPVRSYRFYIFQLFLMTAIVGFAVLTVLARTAAYFPIDLLVTQSFQAFQPYGLLPLMRFISWFGFFPQTLLVIAGLVFFLLVIRFKWEALMAVTAAAAAMILNTVVKFFVARPRPGQSLVHVFAEVGGFSFPSGHVMFYTAFYGFLAFIAYTHLKQGWLRIIMVTIFTLMVVLVGPSRIYLGEHWASDVLGGYLLGSLTLIGAIQLYKRGRPRFLDEAKTGV